MSFKGPCVEGLFPKLALFEVVELVGGLYAGTCS